MTGDECACGICDIESCDVCGEPVAFVDDDGQAWCMRCWDNYQQRIAEIVEERMQSIIHGGSDWMGCETYRRQMREAGR